MHYTMEISRWPASLYCNDVTWAWRRLKSPSWRLFVLRLFFDLTTQKHQSYVGRFPHKGPVMRKGFPHHDVIIIVRVMFSGICDPGMETKGGDTCNPCQANYYKDTAGITDCTACPGATTTDGVTGATALNQCVGKCVLISKHEIPGIILCMCPANERRRYNVTSPLFGWAHKQNDPWDTRNQWLSVTVTWICQQYSPLWCDH